MFLFDLRTVNATVTQMNKKRYLLTPSVSSKKHISYSICMENENHYWLLNVGVKS